MNEKNDPAFYFSGMFAALFVLVVLPMVFGVVKISAQEPEPTNIIGLPPAPICFSNCAVYLPVMAREGVWSQRDPAVENTPTPTPTLTPLPLPTPAPVDPYPGPVPIPTLAVGDCPGWGEMIIDGIECMVCVRDDGNPPEILFCFNDPTQTPEVEP